MSPSVLRKSGAPFIRRGATEQTQPFAIIHRCENCGWEGAPFGETIDGKLRSFCGWKDNKPACVGKGTK